MSKKCMPLWRDVHLQVKKLKTLRARSTFGSWDVEKSARSCGAKHISKSKCTKRTMSGPLLEVEMSKKCAPLWPEAHFEVKMYKAHHARTTFGSWDVEKVHAVVARSTLYTNYTTLRYTPLHYTEWHCTTPTTTTTAATATATAATLHYTTLMTLHYATLHYTTSH